MGTFNLFKQTVLVKLRAGPRTYKKKISKELGRSVFSWDLGFEKIAGGVLKIQDQSGPQPLFSLGRKSSIDKIWYNASMKEAGIFGVEALAYEVPALKKPLQDAINFIEKPMATIDAFLAKYDVKVSALDGLDHTPKYFGVQGKSVGSSKGLPPPPTQC